MYWQVQVCQGRNYLPDQEIQRERYKSARTAYFLASCFTERWEVRGVIVERFSDEGKRIERSILKWEGLPKTLTREVREHDGSISEK